MNCTLCGAAASADAKFCFKCGAVLRGDAGKLPIAASQDKTAATRSDVLWVYLVGVLLVGAYAGVLVPALNGQRPPDPAVNACLVFTGLFFWLLWKRRSRLGWHGALIGVVLGALFAFTAGLIAHFVNSSATPARSLEGVLDPRGTTFSGKYVSGGPPGPKLDCRVLNDIPDSFVDPDGPLNIEMLCVQGLRTVYVDQCNKDPMLQFCRIACSDYPWRKYGFCQRQ